MSKNGESATVDEAASRFFDIEIQVAVEEDGDAEDGEDGQERVQKIEPSAPVSVNIQLENTETDTSASGEAKNTAAEQTSDPTILHFAEEGVEKIESTTTDPASTAGGGDSSSPAADETAQTTEIQFEAESFSIYGVVYTVDFHWNGYYYSIRGGSAITLSQLFVLLDMDAEIAEVESVEFSNPSLVWVGKAENATTIGTLKERNDLTCDYSAEMTEEEIKTIDAQTVKAGDWALISLKAFNTEEAMTVTMKNGDRFVINVTDYQSVSDTVTFKEDKVFIIAYKDGDDYYVLKTNGTTEKLENPENFTDVLDNVDFLDQNYQWKFYYIFEEKGEDHPNYREQYYFIRPLSDPSASISLVNVGETLVQTGTFNIGVPYSEDTSSGFHFEGYSSSGAAVNQLYFDPVTKTLRADASQQSNILVLEQDDKKKYEFTVNTAQPSMGLVSGKDTSGTETGNVETFVTRTKNGKTLNWGVEADSIRNNDQKDANGRYKYVFDYFDINGVRVPDDKVTFTNKAATIDGKDYYYHAKIADGTEGVEIPSNGSVLTAHFKQNPAYVGGTDIEDMSAWIRELRQRIMPLDNEATKKTAEVYDYENRIYRVDLATRSDMVSLDGTVDLGLILDASGSMKFPSKLTPLTSKTDKKDIWKINDNTTEWDYSNNRYKKVWETWGLDQNTYYYVIAESNTRATVYRLFYNTADSSWYRVDASYDDTNSNRAKIGSGTAFSTDTSNAARQYPIYYVAEEDKDYSDANRYIEGTVVNPRFLVLTMRRPASIR